MTTFDNKFAYIKTDEGRKIAWVGPTRHELVYCAIYLDKNDALSRIEFVDPSIIECQNPPSKYEIASFWRGYKSNLFYRDDLYTQPLDFRDEYMDYLNRKNAGGSF
jgi:hypothetical protein